MGAPARALLAALPLQQPSCGRALLDRRPDRLLELVHRERLQHDHHALLGQVALLLLRRLDRRGADDDRDRREGSIHLQLLEQLPAEELARYHLRADLVPDEFRAESLAQSLAGAASGKRFLLVRASRGREVLAEIKADPSLKRIPVVVLTTSRAEEDLARSYDLHANCFITKPVDFDQSIQVVKTIENFWFTIVVLPPV